MANAIHRTGAGDTLASVSGQYYALRQRRGQPEDGALRTITAAIRAATPPEPVPLSGLSDTDPLPIGTTLFIPTLRALNRVVFAEDERLRNGLAQLGFDHARKMLRYSSAQVIELVSSLPADYQAEAVRRVYGLTAFLNLDGMDAYTAQHLYDIVRVRSLTELARRDSKAIDQLLAVLVTTHGRPAALNEQRHGERWVLEAKILTRKRVSELAKARARTFRTPFAPSVAGTRAQFYEAALRDDSLPIEDAALSAKLVKLYRFQEAVLRGNLAVSSGRWSAAVDAYQQARQQWHRLAEDTGAVAQVDDSHGINLRTAIDATRRVLNVLPADDDHPLGAPPLPVRSGRANIAYRLRGFRYDELNPGRRGELKGQLAARPVHQLPARFRSAAYRAVMGKMRGELGRVDPGLVRGLVPGAPRTLMRDLEPGDRHVLRRNLGSAAVSALYGSIDLTASGPEAGGNIDVFDAVGDHLAISDVDALVPHLWRRGESLRTLLSGPAAALYPEGFLDREDVTPFTKYVVLPGATGADDAFVPLTRAFAAEYERRVLAPRLTSADGGDVAFDELCWGSSGAFVAIAPYVYAVLIPLGLRQAYSKLGHRDLAGRYGGMRLNVYGAEGTVERDLASATPSDLIFDLDLYACSSHWVDPTTQAPDFTIYFMDVEDYARWYIDVADRAYRRDDRASARTWYADVTCAIETFWGDNQEGNDLAVQAQTALAGVQWSIGAVRDGQLNAALQNLTTLDVEYESGGVTRQVMEGRFLITRRDAGGRSPIVPSRRHRRQEVRANPSGGPRSGGSARVSVDLDPTLVGGMIVHGDAQITVHQLNTELYSQYLYCTAKIAALDAGLNWYGFPDFHVPPWSFQHLYGIARDLCNRALDCERNTFGLLQTLEAAQKEVLQASQTLEMANETLTLANAAVAQQEAANELAWTQAAIAFNQAGLAASQNESQGAVDLFTGWAGFLFSPLASGGQFLSGAFSLVSGALYTQITNLSHMAWQQTEALNAAGLAVAIAQRDVAELGALQASEYLAFLDGQALDVGAYDYLLALSREVTASYLDHANRLSWLAQRALSHETRQTFNMVKLSYASGEELMDLTQAQRLTVDLESMLATYTAGETRRHQELAWTTTLSQLSPGALRQLRASGEAAFVLSQEMLDRFFPGHYLHSLKDIAMTVLGTLPPTGVRGVLQSSGVSWVRVPNDGSYEDGSDTLDDWTTSHLADVGEAANPAFNGYRGYLMKMIRSMGSSVSLSQFDVQRDRAVLSLPQGMLSSVQHLGMDTAWTLKLHRQANAFDFAEIQDVELTFWLHAAFDDTLAQAQYEALIRQGRRHELQASAVVPSAAERPDVWAAFVGDPVSAEALDLRLLVVDVGNLPPWEMARKVVNILVACAREATLTEEVTLRLCCDQDPVGYRFTTTNGAIFSAIGLLLESRDPRPDREFSAWVKDAMYGFLGKPVADPVARWVFKASSRQLGGGWLKRDEDGSPLMTTSGPLRAPAALSASATATFNAGLAWSDIILKVRLCHRGATPRLRVRDDGSSFYTLEIGPRQLRLLRAAGGAETVLKERTLAYPGDEFLFVELGVVNQTLFVRIDGIVVFDDVTGEGTRERGSIGLEVVSTGAPSHGQAEFDDVEVVRLSKLSAEAETLLTEPFTSVLPSDWSFVSSDGPWSIDPAGHEQLDLRPLRNITLKLDYRHEMVEAAP